MKPRPLAVLILASSFAMCAGAAMAQSSSATSASDTSRSAAGVEYTTGGVGLAARQQLAAQAKQYNLHLEFTFAPNGEFLSGVQVDIMDSRGKSVLATTTDGPWLLAKLPAGNYTVKARYGEVTRTQQVSVGGGRSHMVVRFPASVGDNQVASSSRSGPSVASR